MLRHGHEGRPNGGQRLIDRRRLLACAAAAGVGGAAAWTLAGARGEAPPAPPRASVRPVPETLHGVAVTDPYRWMENPSDPEWRPYLMGQNAYARAVLARIPGRDALAAKISAASGKLVSVAAVQPAGGMIFTEIRPAGANTFKLYVREGLDGRDRLLIDPDSLAAAGSHVSLDYWMASPDGRYIAYGTSPAGSEESVLRFLETATGKASPETIDRAQFGAPSWLPDSSGVFFTRLREGTKHGDVDHYLDSVSWLHQLGADPATDRKMMAKGLDPAVAAQDIDVPIVVATPGASFALGVLQSGVQNEMTVFVSPLGAALSGRPGWSRVCGPEDGVTGGAPLGDDLYLLTHKDAPRFRIVKVSATRPAFAAAVEVAPQSDVVLKGLVAAKDGVYVQALDAGLGQVFRLAPDGARTTLRLPYPGTVAALSADPLAEGCWFLLESWVKPPAVCYGAGDGSVTITNIAPKPDIDVAPYESLETRAKARDGTWVPLSIVYRKGVRRDGSAPLYLTAYGAYGLDIDPGFDPRLPAWLDLGGVYAVAHVRGGGELGEDWHLAGKKLSKPNTWRDCIDCAQHLFATGWTRPGKLAVEGTSAGGIMVGRYLTERPDLLAAAIVRVGDTNSLRAEFMESGPLNIPEFGTVTDADGFKGLAEMDALSHVKDGVRYPAALVTTGVNDPRVAPWEAGKFAARLQAATASAKPVLLRVETDAGHGIGSTRQQRDQETADIYAFILWQTGDPRFRVPTPRAGG